MAAVTGTVLRAYDFEILRQETYTDTDEYEVVSCKCDVTVTAGTYASGDGMSWAPATAIQNATRDGLTQSIWQAAPVAGGKYTSSGTDYLIIGGVCTNTAGTINCDLYQEDITTEQGNGSMASLTWPEPMVFQVTFKRKVIGE
jgi:hypothetical protein